MENSSTKAPGYKDWILETIDQLRKRKARPDLERICHMLERKHGVTFEETEADLERLVDAEIVIKVDYKGSTSYRNAAKWRKNHHLGASPNTSLQENAKHARTIKHIARKARNAVNALTNANNNRAEGASLRDIENWISEKTDGNETPITQLQLLSVLNREVSAGRIKQIPGGSYVCCFDVINKLEHKNKAKPQERTEKLNPTATSSVPSSSPLPAPLSTCSATVVSEAAAVTPPPPPAPKQANPSPGKKGRPPTKRKRFKKTLGPDFEQYDLKDTPRLHIDDKCDYCLLTSDCNRNGSPEDLLFCKDCSAKAHPSCMDYSQDLARRARKSPWQCIDCKTCYICEDSGDADAMLFCDACDKGYHMTCHKPEVMDKPTGKWVCSKCEVELVSEPEKMDYSPSDLAHNPAKADTGGASCLPTPCDSPLHFHDEPKENSMRLDENRKSHLTVKPKTVLASANGHSNISVSSVPDASEWTIQDVADYLTAEGFQNEASFFKEQEIDGKSLLLMKRSDVLTGLTIKLGPALKIYNHVQRLQMRDQSM